jgi:uncharacterized protein (TIGR02646 family)
MKYIPKSFPEPVNLQKYRKWVQNNAARLASLPAKDQWAALHPDRKSELQDVLIQEQGHICAYCNRRIHKGRPEDDDQLRIDHVEPKDPHRNNIFDYYNVVGCCYGDEREKGRTIPPHSLHCDVSKKDNTLPAVLFPTAPSCDQVVLFSAEGELTSTDVDVNYALEVTLNLNCEKLASPRKKVLTPYVNIDLEPEEVSILIAHYVTPDPSGNLEPFCGVILGYLRQNYNYTI